MNDDFEALFGPTNTEIGEAEVTQDRQITSHEVSNDLPDANERHVEDFR